jgi:predicted porin
VQLEQYYDDNVLGADEITGDHRPSPEVSSWNTSIAPILTLGRKSDTSEANLLLGTKRRETYSLSELDGSDERVEASARRVLTPRLSVGGRYRYEFYESYEAIGDPAHLVQAERPDLRWRSAGGDLTYALDKSTELQLDVEWSAREYDESSRVDLFDSENRFAGLTLARELTAADKVGAKVGMSWSEENSVEEPFVPRIRSEDELQTLQGFWERDWSARWSTVLHAGTRRLQSDLERTIFGVTLQDTSDSSSGFVGGGSVYYTYSPRGFVSLSYYRDTRTGTTSSTGAPAIELDTYTVTLRHRLGARVTFSLRGTYTEYEELSSTIDEGSETRMRMLEPRLDWQLRKDLTTYASFRYFDYDEEENFLRRLPTATFQRDYERRVFLVGLRYVFDVFEREP